MKSLHLYANIYESQVIVTFSLSVKVNEYSYYIKQLIVLVSFMQVLRMISPFGIYEKLSINDSLFHHNIMSTIYHGISHQM